MSRSKWLPALGAVVALAAIAGGCQLIKSRSQAILVARHALPPSRIVVERTPEAEARGARLIAISACSGCHGTDLIGGPLRVFGTEVYTPNLTLQPKALSDADIDRALRAGLRPDGTSELVMPAHAYSAFTDDEIAAITARLRALPPQGIELPKPRPGLLLRAALVVGALQTETEKVAAARPPVDAGAPFAAGRHLAAIACGRCHGTDLGGIRDVGPDMTVRGYYSRAQFHALIQKGDAIGEGNMALMTQTAQANFSHFTDAEVDAIYDYLNARDRILVAKAAEAKRR
ncbi:MAG: Cytochrome c, mono- and diheme variant [Caulobacteraceae bacterium]|jgi:cytochrome c553|nr:Cytochrome c, mono- and diheme variant [Caulobacteraceae bacterium]